MDVSDVRNKVVRHLLRALPCVIQCAISDAHIGMIPPFKLTSMLITNTALLPYLSATLLQSKLVKNCVMKKTETRLPVHKPTEASISDVDWPPEGTRKSAGNRGISRGID